MPSGSSGSSATYPAVWKTPSRLAVAKPATAGAATTTARSTSEARLTAGPANVQGPGAVPRSRSWSAPASPWPQPWGHECDRGETTRPERRGGSRRSGPAWSRPAPAQGDPDQHAEAGRSQTDCDEQSDQGRPVRGPGARTLPAAPAI